MSIFSGIRSGIRSGLRAGINPSVEADALSGKIAPADAAQWGALGLAAATDTWGCQEASGNLVSDAGTVLTANASPLYQQAVADWARKAVGFDSTLNQRFLHATYNNVATTSILVLMYAIFGAAPAAVQGVLTAGTNFSGAGLGQTTAPAIRYRNGATIRDTSGAYQNAVTPIIFQHDVTNSKARLLTVDEKIEATFGAAAGSIFGIGTGTSANFSCLYLAAWKGAAAQQSLASLYSMLTVLRWEPSWTP